MDAVATALEDSAASSLEQAAMHTLKAVLAGLLLGAASLGAAVVLAGDDPLLCAVLVAIGAVAASSVLRRALCQRPAAA